MVNYRSYTIKYYVVMFVNPAETVLTDAPITELCACQTRFWREWSVHELTRKK